MKELRHSLLSILQKFVLTYCKAELAFFSLYLGFLPQIFTAYRIAGFCGGCLFIYPLYHFHSLPTLLDIGQIIAAEVST